jgi:ABC-type transport system involved in multi-copper enzyme maturation permease subunit
MRGKLRELIAWEVQDNWAFPILELVIAITIIQVMPIVSLTRGHEEVARPFFEAMLFILVISTAIVFGRSFGEGIEKRKLIVLLSYPVSRTRVFVAKYLANLLTIFLIFGSVLLAEGVSLFMFDNRFPLVIWGFMFLYLFLTVFFTSSLMTFITLAVKRFGLSVLILLICIFGMEYWLSPPRTFTNNPIAYLSLNLGPYSSVVHSYTWYCNTLNIGIARSGVTQTFFLTALGYVLGGGLILLLASLFLINKIDLD